MLSNTLRMGLVRTRASLACIQPHRSISLSPLSLLRDVRADKKKKKGKDDKKKGKGGEVFEWLGPTDVSWAQVLNSQEEPVIMKDADYPDWLWKLDDPLPTLYELERTGFENLTEEEQKRFLKQQRKKQLKENNSNAGKPWAFSK